VDSVLPVGGGATGLSSAATVAEAASMTPGPGRFQGRCMEDRVVRRS
jgi:hypothetical protein